MWGCSVSQGLSTFPTEGPEIAEISDDAVFSSFRVEIGVKNNLQVSYTKLVKYSSYHY